MRRFDRRRTALGKRSQRSRRRLPAASLAALARVLSGGASATLAASDSGRPNGGFMVQTGTGSSATANPGRPNGGFLFGDGGDGSPGGNGGWLFGNGGNGGAGAGAGDGAACNSGKEERLPASSPQTLPSCRNRGMRLRLRGAPLPRTT